VYEIFLKIVDLVHGFGYLGIFIMTFIESTFVPIPAEVTLIPAGFLVHKNEMNFYLVWIISVLGTVGGSLFNYYIALYVGRRILTRYGKYFFINDVKLQKMDRFFERHGSLSIFIGRLLPGIKHFISFPAGLARMDLRTFCIYSAIGGALWCFILIMLGYMIGQNEELIVKYLKQINFIIIISVSVLIALYIWRRNTDSKQ
jgi:membrane protein DedA with SNARE-associated domain